MALGVICQNSLVMVTDGSQFSSTSKRQIRYERAKQKIWIREIDTLCYDDEYDLMFEIRIWILDALQKMPLDLPTLQCSSSFARS